MIDHLRSMAVFATVVGEGSFRAAAKRLGLSPSVVSHHVAQLEARLDCALLYRSTRHLSMTDDGRALHQACARAVEAAGEALEIVTRRRRRVIGHLRVTAPALLATGPFIDDLAAFAESCPDVSLHLHLDDARQNMVRDGFDVAIRIGPLEDSGLRARHLFSAHRVVCAAPALLARHRPVRHPKQLESLPWVRDDTQSGFLDFAKPGAPPHRVELRGRITTTHADAAKHLAIAGAGVQVGPDFFVREELASGALVRLVPAWQLQPAGVYAVWPANASRASLALRFVEFLLARLAANERPARPKPRPK